MAGNLVKNPIRNLYTSTRLMGIKEWIFGSQANNILKQEGVQTTADSVNNQKDQKQELANKDAKTHLQVLAESMFDSDAKKSKHWSEMRFTDMNMKSKTLLNCQATFGRSVPNRALNDIETFGDLLKFYDAPVANAHKPGTLFPNIRDNLTTLPPNLSIEFPPKKREKPQRTPFQNFNDPRHSTFPNKKQKRYR